MDAAAPREEPIPAAGARRSAVVRRALKLSMLVVVLMVHFLSRQHLVQTRPQREGWNYPFVYRTSLAIMAGRGFSMVRFSDAPESKPVVDFLNGQRDGLSPEEFRRFRDSPDSRPVAVPLPEAERPIPHYPPGGELATPLSSLHTTRVFDLYLTAFLWTLFGIRWSVLLTACAAASTGACLLVFLIARRLGGGFWPGLCAAVLYLASPLENDFAIRALRDVSPLWFAALAFACLICLVERFRSAPANWAALAVTGFACTVGSGWRGDVMLFVPFIAASAAVVLLGRRKSWRYLLAGAAAFLVGAAVPLAAIRCLCPGPAPGFLVACQVGYYGESARCNLLGLEDTHEVARDDVDAAETAQQWYADHHPGADPVPVHGPAYGDACFGMYSEEVLPNLYRWTRSFPRYYLRALAACRARDLPIDSTTYLPPLRRPHWMEAAATWLLEPLSLAGPWLFGLGAVVCLLRRPHAAPQEGQGTERGERVRALSLAVFSFYYAGLLFFVLPEMKHAQPLVLPLSVIGGLGMSSLGACVHPMRLAAKVREAWRPALWLAAGTGAAVLVWGLACAVAYGFSMASRRELLAAVTALTETGRPNPEALHGPQLFSVDLLPERGDRPTGYLLRIAAGPGPSTLQCRRLRHELPLAPARLLFTQHRLHPGREQCFFVTCNPAGAFGDPSPLVCTAILDGDARFLSCTRVDLADWRRLPLCTVFVPGECEPGNPVVGGVTSTTRFGENPDLNYMGLTREEVLRLGAAPPAALTLGGR